MPHEIHVIIGLKNIFFYSLEMHQRLSGGEQRLRSVLRKPGVGGVKKRSVTFNESLNLFYEAECSCWIHEDDYHRLRQEEQQQAQQHHHQHHQHHQQFIYEQTHPHYPHTHTHQNFIYEPPPIEFEDPPTLSPPEGYKDRFFPQEDPSDPGTKIIHHNNIRAEFPTYIIQNTIHAHIEAIALLLRFRIVVGCFRFLQVLCFNKSDSFTLSFHIITNKVIYPIDGERSKMDSESCV